jgi:hypothetical protein
MDSHCPFGLVKGRQRSWSGNGRQTASQVLAFVSFPGPTLPGQHYIAARLKQANRYSTANIVFPQISALPNFLKLLVGQLLLVYGQL